MKIWLYICHIIQTTKTQNTMTTSKTYTLTVTETNNKAAKFHYVVTDEAGNVISERRSNREYVACMIDGSFYFGRLDLVGKGDHGRYVKRCIENGKETKPIAYKK